MFKFYNSFFLAMMKILTLIGITCVLGTGLQSILRGAYRLLAVSITWNREELREREAVVHFSPDG